MSAHSPLPWALHDKTDTAVICPDGYVVAACGGHSNNSRDPIEVHNELEANAAMIVRAVNHHDELVAMVAEFVDLLSYLDDAATPEFKAYERAQELLKRIEAK